MVADAVARILDWMCCALGTVFTSTDTENFERSHESEPPLLSFLTGKGETLERLETQKFPVEVLRPLRITRGSKVTTHKYEM